MKNGKTPTRRQKMAIQWYGLNCNNWLVSKADGEYLTLVHREVGRVKKIFKL